MLAYMSTNTHGCRYTVTQETHTLCICFPLPLTAVINHASCSLGAPYAECLIPWSAALKHQIALCPAAADNSVTKSIVHFVGLNQPNGRNGHKSCYDFLSQTWRSVKWRQRDATNYCREIRVGLKCVLKGVWVCSGAATLLRCFKYKLHQLLLQ